MLMGPVTRIHPRPSMRLTVSLIASALVVAPAPAQYGDISDLKLLKSEDKPDVASTTPPREAVVLFGGKSLDAWVSKNDPKKPAPWKLIEGGAVQVQGGDIITKETFGGHFKLHVEFRVPYMPKATGQGRGNSGVYVQGRYEVQ